MWESVVKPAKGNTPAQGKTQGSGRILHNQRPTSVEAFISYDRVIRLGYYVAFGNDE